jgi:hypothetical protein
MRKKGTTSHDSACQDDAALLEKINFAVKAANDSSGDDSASHSCL